MLINDNHCTYKIQKEISIGFANTHRIILGELLNLIEHQKVEYTK